MASNERNNARRDKERKNKAKTKKIIWGILAVIIVILIIFRVCEIDFTSIKKRFTGEDGGFSISSVVDDEGYPYQLASSQNVQLKAVNSKLSVLTNQSFTVLNPATAEATYTFDHGYTNPIIKYGGSYYCIFDQGSTRLRLDTNTKNVYETTLKDNILTADVNSKGTVIYATHSDDAKSAIYVYDSKLKKQTSFNVHSGYVVAVAVDSSGKKIAYAVVNSKDANIVTTVYTVTVGNKKATAKFSFSTDIMDLHYSNSSDLYFVGTDCVSVITNQKKEKKVFEKGTVSTDCFTYNNNNELVYVYSDFSQSTNSSLAYVKSSGNVKKTTKLDSKAKYVSADSNEACVVFADKVCTYSLTRGKLKNTYTCNDSVNCAVKMSSKVYISRQQVIDVIE